MGKIKACLGCFAGMDEEDTRCCKCGWRPGLSFTSKYRWHLGEVLGKRYLVGNIYYDSKLEEVTVFYMYDKLLSMPCFALIKESDDKEEYIRIAQVLESTQAASMGMLVVQTIKKIQGKYVLIFAMRNRHLETEEFESWLRTDIKEKTYKKQERTPQERENVLTAGTVLDDRYQIEDCIGVGGFGITYLCEDLVLERPVAVKEYYPAEWVDREDTYVSVKSSKMLPAYKFGMSSFAKEISISAKFMHTPNFPTVYDAFEDNDTLYMVMEYVDGISVGRMMKVREYKAMEPEEVKEILLPVLEVLEAMHDSQIVHSDISPGNILYTEEKKIYLIDMGAAKYVLDSQPSLDAIFLKIEYAAPEQYRTAVEKKPSDEGPWTDIYALGATAYYMLTGKKPVDVISRLNGETIDFENDIPDAWAGVIEKMMELERSKRIQSVPELKEKIKEIS